MREQIDPASVEKAAYAIIIEDGVTGYFTYDFATPGDGVWHTFDNGIATGATKKVIFAVQMPTIEDEVIHETERTDERDNKANGGQGSQGA